MAELFNKTEQFTEHALKIADHAVWRVGRRSYLANSVACDEYSSRASSSFYLGKVYLLKLI